MWEEGRTSKGGGGRKRVKGERWGGWAKKLEGTVDNARVKMGRGEF